MDINKSSSEVFWRALKELPGTERTEIIRKMIRDREIMKEIFDVILRKCSDK